VNSNLIVTGSITAQTLVVQTITSSVLYSSGSNVFGNASSNTQTFTGSLLVSGSTHSIFGNVVVGNNSSINASAKLEVKGDLFLTPSSSIASIIHLYNKDSTNETYIYDSGSSSNSYLTFAPGGTTRMTINSSGNVLIGTTTDSGFGKLQITGLININTSDTTAASTSQQAYDYSRLRIKATNGSNYGLSFGYSGGNYFYLQSCYNEGSTGPMMINPFGGSVNIGTNTPNGNTLQVLGTTSFLGNMDINSGMTMCAQNLGNVTTSWVSTNLTTLYVGFVFVYWANSVSGERNTAVITCNYYPNGITTISQSNNGGNGVQFQMSGNTLQIKTTSGTAAGVQLVYWKV
jgi:hypothetical protein